MFKKSFLNILVIYDSKLLSFDKQISEIPTSCCTDLYVKTTCQTKKTLRISKTMRHKATVYSLYYGLPKDKEYSLN